MAALERMVYRSTGTGRTDSLLNMATILAESQRNNDRDGLTGALAAHDGQYIQVLEGPAAALDRLLARLEGDRRHRDIVIIDRRPVDARLFDGWTMANARIDPDLAPKLEALMAQMDPAPDAIVALIGGTRLT